jgi:hypothetical protein
VGKPLPGFSSSKFKEPRSKIVFLLLGDLCGAWRLGAFSLANEKWQMKEWQMENVFGIL